MTDTLEEKVARAICLSKQRAGDTDRIAAQYVDTFWRDYLPEARIAVATLAPALAKPASEPADGAVREKERERIARAIEHEASVSPCEEDAEVIAGLALLVRADFSYDAADAYEDKLDQVTRERDDALAKLAALSAPASSSPAEEAQS